MPNYFYENQETTNEGPTISKILISTNINTIIKIVILESSSMFIGTGVFSRTTQK